MGASKGNRLFNITARESCSYQKLALSSIYVRSSSGRCHARIYRKHPEVWPPQSLMFAADSICMGANCAKKKERCPLCDISSTGQRTLGPQLRVSPVAGAPTDRICCKTLTAWDFGDAFLRARQTAGKSLTMTGRLSQLTPSYQAAVRIVRQITKCSEHEPVLFR